MIAQPTVVATSTTDPLSGDPVINIDITGPFLFTGAPTATVLRSDGQYVLGASPLNQLAVPIEASILDYTAPYGVPVTYVVNLTANIFGSPPDYSPPSVPSLPVTMGQAPDTLDLYNRLGWAQSEDLSGELLSWLSGIGEMVESLDSVTTDGYDTNGNLAPGWSQVLDINRCPTEWLPWLAQFVGVALDPTMRDDQQRYAIENPQGWTRGTPAAILATANQYLAPGYSATLLERDTSPYHLTIDIPTGAYAGSTTCLELSYEYPTCADLILAFATCELIWKDFPIGASGATTCATLITSYATCAVLLASVATCADLWIIDFFISNAIAAAVPAGIAVELIYS